MIYTLYLLCFILTTTFIFISNNVYYLIGYIILQIILFIVYRVKLKKLISIILKNWLFILTVLIFNILFSTFLYSLIITSKLLLVIMSTYINSYILDKNKLEIAIKQLFFFTKERDNISLIIIISISLIPIFYNMIHEIKFSLKSRNYKLNIFKNAHILFITFINRIIEKTNNIELSLISRGTNRE